MEGLVAKLAPRVALVTNGAAAAAAQETPLVSRSSVFEGDILYVRIGRVGEGLAAAVKSARNKAATTNQLKGVVLDLRYAGGTDYGAVAPAANLFVRKEQPLLNWGKGMVQAKPDSGGIKLPVAVLANATTAGAAEALAAVLRDTGSGLILGSRTAGQAMVAREFALKNGRQLRIATAPVQVGDGTALTEQGIKPDIVVDVVASAERMFYQDAYALPELTNLMSAAGLSATNLAAMTNRLTAAPALQRGGAGAGAARGHERGGPGGVAQSRTGQADDPGPGAGAGGGSAARAGTGASVPAVIWRLTNPRRAPNFTGLTHG